VWHIHACTVSECAYSHVHGGSVYALTVRVWCVSMHNRTVCTRKYAHSPTMHMWVCTNHSKQCVYTRDYSHSLTVNSEWMCYVCFVCVCVCVCVFWVFVYVMGECVCVCAYVRAVVSTYIPACVRTYVRVCLCVMGVCWCTGYGCLYLFDCVCLCISARAVHA